MSNNVVDILRGVVAELREIAKSETIIGEPVTAGEKTVIPVVKLMVGFGVGGGEGQKEKEGTGFGGGGGGGARIEPAAFIIIDKDEVKLLPVAKGKLDQVIDAIPGLAKKLSKLKDKLMPEKEQEGKESEEGEDDSGKPAT